MAAILNNGGHIEFQRTYSSNESFHIKLPAIWAYYNPLYLDMSNLCKLPESSGGHFEKRPFWSISGHFSKFYQAAIDPAYENTYICVISHSWQKNYCGSVYIQKCTCLFAKVLKYRTRHTDWCSPIRSRLGIKRITDYREPITF